MDKSDEDAYSGLLDALSNFVADEDILKVAWLYYILRIGVGKEATDEDLKLAIEWAEQFVAGSGKNPELAFANRFGGDYYQRQLVNLFYELQFEKRRIYLTFQADCTFTSDHVAHYFSKYGEVIIVKLSPLPQRMHGNVEFAKVETVTDILSRKKLHYICGFQVVVKRFRREASSRNASVHYGSALCHAHDSQPTHAMSQFPVYQPSIPAPIHQTIDPNQTFRRIPNIHSYSPPSGPAPRYQTYAPYLPAQIYQTYGSRPTFNPTLPVLKYAPRPDNFLNSRHAYLQGGIDAIRNPMAALDSVGQWSHQTNAHQPTSSLTPSIQPYGLDPNHPLTSWNEYQGSLSISRGLDAIWNPMVDLCSDDRMRQHHMQPSSTRGTVQPIGPARLRTSAAHRNSSPTPSVQSDTLDPNRPSKEDDLYMPPIRAKGHKQQKRERNHCAVNSAFRETLDTANW